MTLSGGVVDGPFVMDLRMAIKAIPPVVQTTLQGINISHLGKRKIIFKMPFLGDMLVPWSVHGGYTLEKFTC